MSDGFPQLAFALTLLLLLIAWWSWQTIQDIRTLEHKLEATNASLTSIKARLAQQNGVQDDGLSALQETE